MTTRLTDISAAARFPNGDMVLVSNETGLWKLLKGLPVTGASIDYNAVRMAGDVPHDPEGCCVTPAGTFYVLGSDGTICRPFGPGGSAKAPVRMRGFETIALNAEGLTFSAADNALLIGIRAPLFSGKARILIVRKPDVYLSTSKHLAIRDWYEVDLGGLGIRDLATLPGGQVLILAGGSTDGKAQFRLRILGVPSYDYALPKETALGKAPHWEALCVDGDRLHVIADGAGPPTQVYTMEVPRV